jgi:hypothetical protein
MKPRSQIYLLVSLLLFVGLGLTIYKCHVLGFMFTPGTETVWQVQSRIQFDAEGGPAKASLTMNAFDKSLRTVFREKLSDEYECVFVNEDGVRKAVWTRDDAHGMQVIYFRADFYRLRPPVEQEPPTDEKPQDVLEGQLRLAGDDILLRASEAATSDLALAINVLGMMDEERNDPSVKVLLEEVKYRTEYMGQVSKVLAMEGIHSKVVRGLRLQDKYTQRSITTFIQVYAEDKWILLDPKALAQIPFSEALLWPENTHGLLDVYGGSNSSVTFSVSSVQNSASQLAVDAAQLSESKLVDFSIYSLPIEDQNTFKLLLLIPVGALIVVVMRNLVGIRTSGTFMPILIALTFMQTTLLLGLLLFLVVVGVGLVMRYYLSHLNLLLVPRIASVLVFVIIIFAAIGIGSHKLGWHSGHAVLFFPMIILSWTIERMSVLWEEEGPHEVLIQGGGSLLTASLAYLVMISPNLEHLIFNFPELLLVLLAVIIMIGSYSGFRLLELGRFEPMTRDNDDV